ncbi:peroxidase [Acinetobacter indicus]|uniref:alpha/beta fold hydrolase n=1 Tax=Acinetobacter indicus TaxID=756892 RepID=UPI0005F82504|nr:alpha/beta hydrolase [Acinetobacter indicus]KJV45008.1 peroxidase [Acinetobacter indicus]
MPYYVMPDGEGLFVREFGQGQPVLVLSGLGMHSWQWLPFLWPLRKQFRFIIPDWRGFGGSKQCRIPELDAISSHWQDVQSLIQQLQLRQFMIIAYSMGATTAMHGMQYGQLATQLKAYLHIDQTPKIMVDEHWAYGLFGQQHSRFKQILSELSALFTEHAHLRWIHDLNNTAKDQLFALWMQFIELQNNNPRQRAIFRKILQQPRLQNLLLPSSRLDYMAWYIRNYLEHAEDYREALSQLNCPTVFFSGVQSVLYPVQGQTLIAQSVAQARQVLFEKSGHTPLLTEPLKFAREIKRFLLQHQ